MSNNTSSSGIGFLGPLAILFIGLKLGGIIMWSWWWVTAPIWGPIAVVLGVLSLITIFLLFMAFIKYSVQSYTNRKKAKRNQSNRFV